MAWKGQRRNTEWKKIFANDVTDKVLISKIYKQLIQFNIKKKSNQKMGQKTLVDIFPKKTYRWSKST